MIFKSSAWMMAILALGLVAATGQASADSRIARSVAAPAGAAPLVEKVGYAGYRGSNFGYRAYGYRSHYGHGGHGYSPYRSRGVHGYSTYRPFYGGGYGRPYYRGYYGGHHRHYRRFRFNSP